MSISASEVKALREKSGAGMMDCKKALTECEGNIEEALDWLRKKGLGAAAKKAARVATEGLVTAVSNGKTGVLVEVNSETDFVSRNEHFQDFVENIAKIALDVDGSLEDLKKAPYPEEGRTVEEQLTHLIAIIGENMTLRRVERISVSEGAVVSYVHSTVKQGLGKIAVLVALESKADKGALEDLGKQLSMHIAATGPQSIYVEDLDKELVERERKVLSDQARESGKPEAVIEKMIEGRIRKFYEEIVLHEQIFVIDNETKVSKVVEMVSKEHGSPIQIAAFSRYVLGEGIEKKEDDFASEVANLAG